MTKKTFQIAVISASILLTGLFRLLGQTAEQWLKDVDTLTALIEKHHPKLWEKISREKFMKQAEGIKAGLPDWSVEKITIELMGLVASQGDGHSEILLNGVERFNLWFPLRMESFHDGVFITACDEAHGELLGAQVLKLDGTEMKEALKKIGVITPKDSDIAASRLIANYLPNAVILKTLQITEKSEAMQLEVLDAGGNIKSVSISSAPWGMTGNWTWNKTAVPTKNKKVSIYQEHQDKLPHYLAKMVPLRIPYWFELYDDKKLLFFQWNQIANWRRDPIGDFTKRLFLAFDENAETLDKFVIDLRFNEGGNGLLARPFVQELILRRNLLPRGRLYIITGRHTFSAASNLIGQMLKQTNAVTVGDIAPGPLNWCSDVIDFRLTNSALIVNISTMFWMEGHATDRRGFYPPECFIPQTFKDLISFVDRPLEMIKGNRIEPLMDILLSKGWGSFYTEFEKIKTNYPDVKNWFPYTHFELVQTAYFKLLPAGKGSDAVELLRLNTEIFPSEFRSWYGLAEIAKETGQIDVALQAHEKLRTLEPCIAEMQTSYCNLRLLKRYVEKGPEALRKLFLELRESQGNILSENTLNILGYEMLRKGKNQDAAEIFRINTRLYPEWANGYDSLGEAYLKANDKKSAREAYEKALKLDPGLSSAKLALEQLNKEKIKTK